MITIKPRVSGSNQTKPPASNATTPNTVNGKGAASFLAPWKKHKPYCFTESLLKYLSYIVCVRILLLDKCLIDLLSRIHIIFSVN